MIGVAGPRRVLTAAAPASERTRIEANYRKIAASSQGTYALIDHVNFKGDGTLATGTAAST